MVRKLIGGAVAVLVLVAAGTLGGSAASADSSSCVGPGELASYSSTVEAVNRYRSTYGERPLSLAQVVDAGYLNSVPLDMSYDAVTGEVSCGTGAVGLTDGEAQTAVGFMIVVLIIMFVGYFIPTIVAVARGLPGIGGIVAINVLLGWSLIGWAVALAMALRSKPPTYRLATSGVGSPAVGYAPTAPGGAMSWAPPGGYPPPPPGAGYAAPAGGYPPPPPPADGYGPPAGWAPPVGPNDRTF